MFWLPFWSRSIYLFIYLGENSSFTRENRFSHDEKIHEKYSIDREDFVDSRTD